MRRPVLRRTGQEAYSTLRRESQNNFSAGAACHLHFSAELVGQQMDHLEPQRLPALVLQVQWETAAVVAHAQHDLSLVAILERDVDATVLAVRKRMFQRI